MKAVDVFDRMNLRRLRAESLIAAVMLALRPHLAQDSERDVYYALAEMFHDQGVEVVTDYERQQYGLPPRGPDGWTADEIRTLEQRRLEALLRPLAMPTFDASVAWPRPK